MNLSKTSSKLLILFAIICLGVLVSISLNKGFQKKIAQEIGLKPKTSWVGQYLSGYHATREKDYLKASEFFSESLNYHSNSEVLQTQAMSLLLVSGKFSQAVAIAKDLNRKSDNGLARLTLIVDAVNKNQLAEAEILTADTNDDSATIINKIIKAWVKFGQGRSQEAMDLLKTLQGDDVFLPFVNYNYALIAHLSGDKATARKLFDSLLASGTQLPTGIISSAYDFYAAAGDKAKLALISSKYDYDGKVNKHPRVTNVKEGVAEALLGVGGIIMTQYSPDKSAAIFRLALYLNPKLDDAKLLLGSILMTEGDYKGANKILNQIAKSSYLGNYAKLAIAKNFEAMDQDEKAKEYFEDLTKIKETSIDAYISLADLARKKEDYAEAAKYYTSALEAARTQSKTGEIDKKYWAIYFARGVCYERLKDWDKSEADLQTALKLHPNQPDVMNYLAYTWIDSGKNLNLAKDMVLKAHKEKPDDPQIIDSVGWAFFKLGNYANSVQYLEAAASLLPYDPTVNDHLGDAYWQTGRKNEARFQWERALRNNPDARLSSELQKKLESGLPAVSKLPEEDNVAAETSRKAKENALR